MELKYLKRGTKVFVRGNVLIAPLWNWNEYKDKVAAIAQDGSNRTFMELK